MPGHLPGVGFSLKDRALQDRGPLCVYKDGQDPTLMRVGVELSVPRAGIGTPYESLVPVGKEGNR